jgi:glycosyltransferase involved in cell wall biosynthesis
MKIGIDCRTILNPSGGEQAGVAHYTYYLVKNLIDIDSENQYVLFFDKRFKDISEFSKYKNVIVKYFPNHRWKKYLPFIYSQVLILKTINRENLDIFHSPANTLPLGYKKKSVITVHDLGIYKFPDFFPRNRFSGQAYATRVLVPKSISRAEKIIAVSKNTKKDIVEEFGTDEEKIEVVYEGVLTKKEICHDISSLDEIKKHHGIAGKFILFLGTIEPRKNIVMLVKAFRSASLIYDSPLRDYQLIIAGARGWHDAPVYQVISDANASILGISEKRSGSERRSGLDIRPKPKKAQQGERRVASGRRVTQPIKYIGYASHADKMALLCNTSCFVFPSLYEGFGLPVLEAMSLGAPVITSNISSLPEVTGSDGAILVDPSKESEIADAIVKIISDDGLRESLVISGHKRSKYFSWRKCAKETLEVYKSI